MGMLVRAIGIFMVAMGMMIVVNPMVAKRMMVFWRQGKRIYFGGAIRILLGIIFLFHAPQAKSAMAMTMLGVLALLGGIIIIILGPKRAGLIIEHWQSKPDSFLRLLSLTILAFGSLVIFSA